MQRVESKGSSVSSVSTGSGGTVITSKSDGGTSQVVTGQAAPEAFLLTLRMTLRPGGGGPGRVEIGPYRGSSGGPGYRLAFRTGGGDGPALQLLRLDAGGSATALAVYGGPLRLDDGRPREILWQRDGAGRMTVSAEGEELLAAADSSLSGSTRAGFDGLVVVNRGGHAEIAELTIEAAGR